MEQTNYQQDSNQFGNQPVQQPSQPYMVQDAIPNSTAVLVLGIISIVTCWCYGVIGLILSIIALILSSSANKLYQQDPNKYSKGSYQNLKAGKVCAIIGLILSSLYIIFIVLYFFAIFSIFSPSLMNTFDSFRF
jgi:uncharacterized protein YacL